MNLFTIVLFAIKASVTLTLLYLPYLLLMRHESMFRLNRIVLLGIILLSFLLPLVNITIGDFTLFGNLHELEALASTGEMGIANAGIITEYTTIGKPTTETPIWPFIVIAIYITGLGLCLVYKILQFIRLYVNMPKGCLWIDRHNGATVYCKLANTAPFSWMQSIVLSEDDFREPEVLLHESAHISKGHSWDTLFVTAAEVIQWFNPCIWLLHTSLREVHEYEADDVVLHSGISIQQYQLLLIKKAVGTSSYAFANSFNHSQLKRRFTMMLKPKPNRWSGAKALYIIPVAAIAVIALSSAKNPSTPSINNDGIENTPAYKAFNLHCTDTIGPQAATPEHFDSINAIKCTIMVNRKGKIAYHRPNEKTKLNITIDELKQMVTKVSANHSIDATIEVDLTAPESVVNQIKQILRSTNRSRIRYNMPVFVEHLKSASNPPTGS